MSVLTREDIEATTSILADIEHVDREIEATIRRTRELKKNRRSLTEELEELHTQQQQQEEEGEVETSSPPTPTSQNKCGGATRSARQVSEEPKLSKETASLSACAGKKEEETSPRISLLALRSQDDTEGDGLVQNQVRSRVAQDSKISSR